jgi:hypothetical protein
MPMQCGSIFKGKHASQNLNRPNTTRVAYRTSEASFSPYPLSPWWWPNYGKRRQRLVCNGGAVHLCAITQIEEARLFFIELGFWRCGFLNQSNFLCFIKVHKAGAYYNYIQFHMNIIDLLNSEVEHRLQNKLSGEVFFSSDQSA